MSLRSFASTCRLTQTFQDGGCYNFRVSLHVKANDQRHDARLQKYKIEQKYVYIRLEMLSSIYLPVRSVQIDIFEYISHGGRCIHHTVGDMVTRCEKRATIETHSPLTSPCFHCLHDIGILLCFMRVNINFTAKEMANVFHNGKDSVL